MDKLYSVKEVAQILNVSEYTIYNLTQKGKLPFIRLNNRKLFTEEIIKDFLITQSNS